MTDATVLGPDGKEYPTGDLEPLLRCGSCDQLKRLSEFHHDASKPHRLNRAAHCAACKNAAARDARRQSYKPRPAVAERREKVLELLGHKFSIREIAAQLGYAESTIGNDARALEEEGLYRRNNDRTIKAQSNVAVADSVLQQLDGLAALVHDGSRIILQLEGLSIEPDMAGEWEKRLRHIGQALRYLRSHAKKGNI